MAEITPLETRLKVINLRAQLDEKGKPTSLRAIAKAFNLDKVTVKKILDRHAAGLPYETARSFDVSGTMYERLDRESGWNSMYLRRPPEGLTKGLTTYRLTPEEIAEKYGRPGVQTEDKRLTRAINEVLKGGLQS